MSAPANVIQGLLAPWMTGANPSALDTGFAQYGGTQGLLNAMMQAQSPTMLGQAMQNAQTNALRNAAARQQLASGTIGLQQNMAMFPYLMGALKGYAGGGNPAPQTSAAPVSGAPATGQPPAAGAAPAASAAPSVAPSGQAGSLGAGLNLARVLSLMGRPGADTFLRSLTADPGYITQSAVAKDPLIVDRSMVYDAYRRGDMQGAQQAYFKLLKDSGQVTVDRYGNVVTLGGIKPTDLGVSTFLPQQGVQTTGGVMSAIPGAAATRAALGAAQTGAEERARLQAQTAPAGAPPVPPPTAGARVPAPLEGRPVSIVPPSKLVGAQAINQPGYVPPILNAAGQIQTQPGRTGLAQQAQFQKDQATTASENLRQFSEQAQGANELLAQTAEIREAANDFTPGKFANYRAEVLNVLNSAGLISDKDKERLGSYQMGQKLAIQLQASATKQLGSREAAQIFTYMGKSMPNLTLTPDGLEKVSAYLDGIARYKLARNAYAQRLAAQNNVPGINMLESVFQTNSNPTFFILASASPQARAEMVAAMPATARQRLMVEWKRAAAAGLAPGPADYTGQ